MVWISNLEKFIPVAAGMAGGSSDAAAALVGINRLFKLGLSQKELMDRAVNIGGRCSVLCDERNCPGRGDRGETDQDHSGARLFCTDR